MGYIEDKQAQAAVAQKAAAYDQMMQQAYLQQVHAMGAQQGFDQGVQQGVLAANQQQFAQPSNAAEAAAIQRFKEQQYLNSTQGNPQVTTPVQTQQGGNAMLAEDPRDAMSPQTAAWLQRIQGNK